MVTFLLESKQFDFLAVIVAAKRFYILCISRFNFILSQNAEVSVTKIAIINSLLDWLH